MTPEELLADARAEIRFVHERIDALVAHIEGILGIKVVMPTGPTAPVAASVPGDVAAPMTAVEGALSPAAAAAPPPEGDAPSPAIKAAPGEPPTTPLALPENVQPATGGTDGSPA